jgi:hypothetical protein
VVEVLRVSFVLLILLLTAIGCSAQTSADKLLTLCTDESNIGCLGYLVGFMDGIEVQSSIRQSPKIYCSPEDGISTEQVRRIVIKFMKEHPKELHGSARTLVLLALKDAFPCKQ